MFVAGHSHQMTTVHEATKSLLPRTTCVRRTTSYGYIELSMGSVDPWVGLGRDFSVFGGLVSSTVAIVGLLKI